MKTLALLRRLQLFPLVTSGATRLLSLLLLAAVSATAQFAIDRSAFGGGGGQSAGGLYTLNGTIGEPAAETAHGGNYSLQAGFWSAFGVVPTEGAPSLRIVYNGRSVVLAWPASSASFQLQESPSLSTPAWTDVRTSPSTVGSENQVVQSLEPGARFYRLRKP